MKNKKIGKKIVFILNIEPYCQEVIVVCNGQFSDAFKKLKRYKSKNALETIKYIEENKDKYKDDHKGGATLYTKLPHGYVMLVDHQDSWIDTVGDVTHESMHLTHYILMRAGLILSQESEEAFTYLAESITERILRKIF